ncbi:hypothetical protein JCM11641_008463 [Rhodosporidiobolus odoratus]
MTSSLKSSNKNNNPSLTTSSSSLTTPSASHLPLPLDRQRKPDITTILPASSDSDSSRFEGEEKPSTTPIHKYSCLQPTPSLRDSSASTPSLTSQLSSQPISTEFQLHLAASFCEVDFLDLTHLDDDLNPSELILQKRLRRMLWPRPPAALRTLTMTRLSRRKMDLFQIFITPTTSPPSQRAVPPTPGYDETKSRKDYFRASGWLHHLSHPIPAARKRILADAEKGKAAALKMGREDDQELGVAFYGALDGLYFDGIGEAHEMSPALLDRMKLAKEGRQAQSKLEQEREERRQQQQQSGKGKGKCPPSYRPVTRPLHVSAERIPTVKNRWTIRHR